MDFEAYLTPETVIPQIVKESSMFTAQYQLIMDHVDRNILAQIITNEYDTFCIFKTDEYPGLKIFYHKDGIKVTIIIHRSMKISFNGANSFENVKTAHNFINTIIKENQNRILVSLNDVDTDSDFD
jgi:TATA-box binding protein (TBP) (component of TFIID and TFIIIB)